MYKFVGKILIDRRWELTAMHFIMVLKQWMFEITAESNFSNVDSQGFRQSDTLSISFD